MLTNPAAGFRFLWCSDDKDVADELDAFRAPIAVRSFLLLGWPESNAVLLMRLGVDESCCEPFEDAAGVDGVDGIV